MKRKLIPSECSVGLFTGGYILAFTLWFFSIGNYEFIVYVITMLGLVLLVGLSLDKAAYSGAMLWALSLWGLMHMAGGGVPVDGSVCLTSALVGQI